MGFYVLFRRHSLLNATLYFGLFIASLYSFVFPVFLMVGSRPGPSFHVINYWAHLWMGVAAAFTPVLFGRIWPRLRRPGRTLVTAGLAAAWLTPYAFALGQATSWQPGAEAALERAAFDRVTLQPDGPLRVAVGGQAGYLLTTRLGPREYETYAHVHKAVDVTGIHLTGRLTDQTGTLAWCTGDTDQLPGTHDVRDPQKYFPVLDRVDYATLAVICTGPIGPHSPGTTVTVQWSASMTMHGERTSQSRDLSGSAQAVLP